MDRTMSQSVRENQEGSKTEARLPLIHLDLIQATNFVGELIERRRAGAAGLAASRLLYTALTSQDLT